jgi:type IV pilus assembly protein PilV
MRASPPSTHFAHGARRAGGTRRAHGSGGYTVIEILLAMTLLTIGAAGVMSMQKASIQGNLDARRTDVAIAIGRMWMERIRKDAMAWTVPGGVSFNNAGLLSYSNGASANKWVVPSVYLPATSPLASISPGFDILGRDVPTVAGLTSATNPPFFCVQLRESWVVGDNTTVDGMIRVDLRVVWRRGISTSAFADSACNVTTDYLDGSQYATLYLSTIARMNGVPK